MFKAGQLVRHKTRNFRGSVLEVDGDVVYLETSDGVEMQFPVRDMVPDTAPAQIAEAALDQTKYREILNLMPEGVVGLAAVAFARAPSSPRNGWAGLLEREKLAWVVKVTGLPAETLRDLAKSGKAREISAHASVTRGKATVRRGD